MRSRVGEILLAALLLCSLDGCLKTDSALYEVVPTPRASRLEEEIVEKVNEIRRGEGLGALAPDEGLHRLARIQAREMVRMGKISHQDREGLTVEKRAGRMRIDWLEIGENVARNRGYDDPAAKAADHWMQSPGHRANILKGEYLRTGVGVARGSDNFYYFVQVFMTPVGD